MRNSKNPKTETVRIHIHPKRKQLLSQLADDRGCTIEQYVEMIIAHHLATAIGAPLISVSLNEEIFNTAEHLQKDAQKIKTSVDNRNLTATHKHTLLLLQQPENQYIPADAFIFQNEQVIKRTAPHPEHQTYYTGYHNPIFPDPKTQFDNSMSEVYSVKFNNQTFFFQYTPEGIAPTDWNGYALFDYLNLGLEPEKFPYLQPAIDETLLAELTDYIINYASNTEKNITPLITETFKYWEYSDVNIFN